MLLEYIVNYCDNIYKRHKGSDALICTNCNHPKVCGGSCCSCLDEIHFPDVHPMGKKVYDCFLLLNYYVCRYSYKYCSEIEYALSTLDDFLSLKKYKVMSIGCGGAPDLMALEYYFKSRNLHNPIHYIGYDINELWKPIHDKIKEYESDIFEAHFYYVDAIEYFEKYYVKDVNVVILQYVISYFYNNNQIDKIDSFFDNLVDNIVLGGRKGKLYIIINDVNSYRRGRDFFQLMFRKLKDNRLNAKMWQRYFDYNIKQEGQRYGRPHHSCSCLHTIPDSISSFYCCAKHCSSAQLLFEVEPI